MFWQKGNVKMRNWAQSSRAFNAHSSRAMTIAGYDPRTCLTMVGAIAPTMKPLLTKRRFVPMCWLVVQPTTRRCNRWRKPLPRVGRNSLSPPIRDGYAATTFKAMAQVAGVAPGLIHHYFANIAHKDRISGHNLLTNRAYASSQPDQFPRQSHFWLDRLYPPT